MRAFILCGSRDWTDYGAICNALLPIQPADHILLIHGDAPGADNLGAIAWGRRNGLLLPMPAQWDRDGKAAGPIRNEAMLRVLLALQLCGYEVSVEAFSLPQSVGTRHMKRIAIAAGVTANEHGRTE